MTAPGPRQIRLTRTARLTIPTLRPRPTRSARQANMSSMDIIARLPIETKLGSAECTTDMTETNRMARKNWATSLPRTTRIPRLTRLTRLTSVIRRTNRTSHDRQTSITSTTTQPRMTSSLGRLDLKFPLG